MKTSREVAVGGLVLLTALFFFGANFTVQAQTYRSVRPAPRFPFTQIPAFSNNPAALELITNLIAEPQPELSVPEVSQTFSPPGTYWTLKGAPAPLPCDPFPDLPVYAVSSNGVYLIDDRSVDYASLEALQQAENEALGLTNQPMNSCPYCDSGLLWIAVPTNSLTPPGYFNVNLMNSIEGQNYDILTAADLRSAWATELVVTGAVGNLTPVTLSMNNRTNLFVRARTSVAFSFYLTTGPLSQEACYGDTVTFRVDTGGNTNLTFQWMFNSTPIPGATNNTYTIYNVLPGDIGYYACVISDGTNSLITAAAELKKWGYSGDDLLFPVIGPRQDYTFKSGMTYYIGSPVELYGQTTIEAGAVLKFDYEYSDDSSLIIMGGLNCKTGPYNPAILTSIADVSAGEWLYFSGWWPETVISGIPYLDLTCSTSNRISNLRFCYADWGVTTPANTPMLDVWDCQFFACNYGVVNLVAGSSIDSLHNVLFASCVVGVAASTNSIIVCGEQVTADVEDFCLSSLPPSRIALTNSIVWGHALSAASVATVNVAMNPDNTNFALVGEGNYYLAASSPLHHSGTPNISPQLQTELQQKTTFPPLAIAPNITIGGQITLSPQVPRYTNGAPDLGYYYAALDYDVAGLNLAGGNLTVSPGTVVGFCNSLFTNSDGSIQWTIDGIYVSQGGTVSSHGTPDKPILFAAADLVQEAPNLDFARVLNIYSRFYGGWIPGISAFVSDAEPGDPVSPSMDFRFCGFYMPEADQHIGAGQTYDGTWISSPDSAVNLILRDCSLHNGLVNLGEPDWRYPTNLVFGSGSVTWQNNLFDNVRINLDLTLYEFGCDDQGLNVDLAFYAYNNLFRGGRWLHIEPIPASAGHWAFRDNLFDRVDFVQGNNPTPVQPLDFDHNAYWPLTTNELAWDWEWCQYWWAGNTATFTPTSTSDGSAEVMLANAPPYAGGPFGNYYLPDTAPLYGAGSDTAANLGLYHYTTRLDQMREGDDTSKPNANIGLHYVAANSYGQPLDTDGDGIPDYVENWHGDGDTGPNRIHTADETDWQNPMTDGITPDASNSIYDAVDLDGDGLTGAAERMLNTSPLIPDNPLDFSRLNLPTPLSGIITIPLNINTNVDTNAPILLTVNGIAADTVVFQTNGNWYARWDTTATANGIYQLGFEIPTDQGESLVAGSCFAQVQNAVCFPDNLSLCGDSLYVHAQTVDTNGTWTMTVYDDQGNLFTNLTGMVDANGFCDYPDTTQEGVIISLLDDNGDQLPSNYYDVTVTAYPAATTSSRFRANGANSGGASSGFKRYYNEKLHGGEHRNWVIAYKPIYQADTADNSAEKLSDMMEGAAQLVHASQYGINNDAVINQQNTTWGYPYTFTLEQGRDWSVLVKLLQFSEARNFVYFGHGWSDLIGNRGGNNLNAALLQSILQNIADPLKDNPTNPASLHPYRFVFLDGCETAKGDLPEIFGIPKKTVSEDDWNNKYHLFQRAFLGWKGLDMVHINKTMPEDHLQFYEGFWNAWTGQHPGLQDAINNASPVWDYWLQQNVPGSLSKSITLYGCPTLQFYQ